MKDTKWNELRGDGGTQRCTPQRLVEIKAEFDQLCTDAGNSANDRRQLADDTRFCRWPGQSPDGKKHADAQAGKAAFPFEGASDKRERTADNITNEQVIIIMAALMRLNIGFTGVPGQRAKTNEQLATSLSGLWEYVKRNHLGVEFFTEWTKFVQWRQGDSPAVGIMQVCWHQDTALRLTTATSEQVLAQALDAMAAQKMELTPEVHLDLQDLLVNPERVDELPSLLQALWPDLRDDTAAKAAKALQAKGTASFPVPEIVENRLRLKARRLFDDIFIPANSPSADFNRRGRVIFVRDWVSEAELKERNNKGEFNPGFIEEVLKHEGASGWKYWCRYDAAGDFNSEPIQRDWDKDQQRGLYELITAIYKGFNADGIPGIYQVTYHADVELPGTDQELIDYDLGNRMAFVVSPREILTSRLWDSRGNSELSATEQNALKLLHDSFMDNVQLSTVPPIEVPASRPKMALVWGPLKQIRVQRPGEIKPFQPFPFPLGNEKMQAIIKEGIARYFGQFSTTNPPDLVRLYNQSLVDYMLLPVIEVMWMGIKLALQYLPKEQLQEILGADFPADDAARRALGEFRVEAGFEAGMLSLEYLKIVGELITSFVLSWDKNQTIPRDVLVKWFMSSLSPTIANQLVRPVDEANQGEIEDEEANFTKISAGIEPPMLEDGQNYELRRTTLLGIGQKNPQAFQALTQNSRLILEARLKHFDGMLEQERNAVIGRTMATPALDEAAV